MGKMENRSKTLKNSAEWGPWLSYKHVKQSVLPKEKAGTSGVPVFKLNCGVEF
jgi:hypothetical protein